MIKLKSLIIEQNLHLLQLQKNLGDYLRYYEIANGNEWERERCKKEIQLLLKAIQKERKKDTQQIDRDAFLRHHYTGHIPSTAYTQYQKLGGLSWLGKKSKYPKLLATQQHGNYNVEYRQTGEKNQYVKTDAKGDIVRDVKGNALMMSDDEIKKDDLAVYDTTVVAFIGDTPVGFAANEFGVVGVWVEGPYQKLGIGSDLGVFHIQQRKHVLHGRSRLGQMTDSGIHLTKKIYDKMEKIHGRGWFEKMKHKTPEKLTESFDLPSSIDIQAEKLAKFIASIFLKDIRKEISNTKRKADYYIVKYHESYRLATKYRNEGKHLFGVIRDNEPTDWGEASIRIYSKNDVLPDTLLFITNNYHTSNDGYMHSIENPQEIVILVSKDNFVEQFKKSTEELIDTVKHEVRHWYQATDVIGLPKTKILNKDVDIMGTSLNPANSGTITQLPHHMQDIEFKTNLHSYAFHIKRSLNKNVPKHEWKKEFYEIVSGGLVYGGNPMMNSIIDNLEDMMKKDRPRWRQFVKELYKLVFPND